MARSVKVEASIRDRMTQRLQRMERQVNRYGRTWERSGRMAQRASRLMGRGMSVLGRGLHLLWRRARLAMLALQVMASVMGGMAVKAAMEYERSLRSVFTLMEDAGSATAEFEAKFVEMDATLRGISTRTKAMPRDLAEGLYEVVSTGFEAADAAVVLEAAAKGAYAGLTDVDTAAGLLTGTLQAFRGEGETSAEMAARSTEVMDMFFNAVNVGVFTFEELGQKFGDVASTASAFGVKLEDLLAFLSTATVRGVGLDEAITSARQTLLSIAAATPASKKALEELFGSSEKVRESFSAQALAENGLIGVMSSLSEVIGAKVDKSIIDMAVAMEEDGGDAAGFLAEKIGITVEALTEIFPNIRALKGVLAVSGPGLETYAEHWEHIGTNIGAVDRASAEIDKSASGALQGLKAVWEQFKIDVGGIALPWIKSISDNLVEWWGGLPERFAREQGTLPPITPNMGPMELQGRNDQIEKLWAGADPGEKISFILQVAWRDAMDNLVAWFTRGGEGRVEALGEKIGSFFGDVLSTAFGLEADDVEDGIFYKIGLAAARGFKKGFTENFSLTEALGNVATGEGVLGGILQGVIGWKLLKGLLGRGTAAAAGTGSSVAAAGGAGILGRLFGGAGGFTTGILGLLSVGAVSEDLKAHSQGDPSLIMSALGMFGIGPENVWSGQKKPTGPPTPQTFHDPAALRGLGPGNSSVARHQDRIAQRQETAAKSIETGGREVDTASANMSRAGERQIEAASKMLLAADRLGSVRLGFPGLGGPGSQSNAGRSATPKYEAIGGRGTVTKPTLFLAGEAGNEDFEFTPHRGGQMSRGGGRSLSVAGPLIGHVTVAGDYDVKKMLAAVNREIEKAFSNG